MHQIDPIGMPIHPNRTQIDPLRTQIFACRPAGSPAIVQVLAVSHVRAKSAGS